MAQLGRDALLQHRRGHRLQDARLVGAPQPAGVDRDQHVGRAVAALGLDPLDQLVGVALDQVDLDPGLLGEPVVERDVGVVVPRRVEVDLLRAAPDAGKREREPDRAGKPFATKVSSWSVRPST